MAREGRLECTVGEQRVQLHEGDELYIPRNTRHSVKNIHTATTRWLFGYD